MIEKQPSCDDVTEPELLPVSVAQQRLFESLKPLTKVERVSIDDALFRVLSEGVVSPMDVPAQANSAMDGYALSSASIPSTGESSLAVVGTAWAGRPFESEIRVGECVRIYTGAIMPAGADTVVIQEHVRATDDKIDIDADVTAAKNVRMAGEDVEAVSYTHLTLPTKA